MPRVLPVLSQWLDENFRQRVVAARIVPRHARWLAMRAMGYDVQRCVIAHGVFIGSTKVVISRGAFVNHGAFIDGAASVVIGRDVSIGPQVTILTGSHEVGTSTKRAGADIARPVWIGDGAWIGAQALLLPGIHVGHGTVVAAGAVVVADCDDNSLYVGNPARKVKTYSSNHPRGAADKRREST